jgi:hypothetical protein
VEQEAGHGTQQGEGTEGAGRASEGREGKRGLAVEDAWDGAWKFDVVAMAGTRIHLDFPVGLGLGGQGESELAIPIGVSQLDGGLARGAHHAHRRIAGGETCGKLAFQLIGAAESRAAQPLQGTLNPMGMNRRGDQQSEGAATEE